MAKWRYFFAASIVFCSYQVFAQSTYLPEESKAYPLLDRLEIKQGKNNLNFSNIKPYNRKFAVREVEYADSLSEIGELSLTDIDRYNIRSMKINNREWVPDEEQESLKSKHPIWNSFYKSPATLFEVDTKDFFLAVNPIVYFQLGSGKDPYDFMYNRRGVTIRGRIADKIGFSSTISDNQERGPMFFKEYVTDHRAVPGVGFYKRFKNNGYDYFDGRGYFTFNVAKYIDFQFGYDKNFIGDGYRSLFLDDFGNSYLFLKLNTRIWKLDYQNLFMELMPTFEKHGDVLLDKKYAAMHHLSINVTNWLNVGLFESVVFSRRNHFDFEYLNPIIFLRHIEGALGSPDKAKAGLDVKANVAKKFQFYGQFLLDEFQLKEAFKGNGYFHNKTAYQLGAKYVDAFGIENLDLQVESNRIRPFTYTHNDSITDYTHYNMPLAHPLGANLQEYVGILRYQPLPKWHLDARAIYYYQGRDSTVHFFGGDSLTNFGSNIFREYSTRTMPYGNFVGTGRKVKVANISARIGYELRENLFIEGNVLFRKETKIPAKTYFNIGVRWNAPWRDYNY